MYCKSISIFYLLFITACTLFAQDNNYCFRCHDMKTLAYRDTISGAVINLSVDKEKYQHSNHLRLKCVDCHKAGFDKFPHPDNSVKENLYCTDCHKNDSKFEKYNFPEIENDFHKSVHYVKLNNKFNCFSCHDAHEFEITQKKEYVADIINYDNSICLKCHNSKFNFSKLTDKEMPDIPSLHEWLPNKELHRKNVRCVECHTPDKESFSHVILGKDKAQQNCEKCHSGNSILLTKLYKYRTKEAQSKSGFINGTVLNQSYVIGMTKNVFLDNLSILIFSLTVIGIIIHSIGRYAGNHKKSGRRNKN